MLSTLVIRHRGCFPLWTHTARSTKGGISFFAAESGQRYTVFSYSRENPSFFNSHAEYHSSYMIDYPTEFFDFLVEKGPWSFGLDGIYMGLGGSSDDPPAEAAMDQWLVELNGAYQFKPWLHGLVGARYNFLSGDIACEGRQEREKSGNVDWIDPVIGARLAAPLAEKWTVRGRADIGGFGLSSNLTWQLSLLRI